MIKTADEWIKTELPRICHDTSPETFTWIGKAAFADGFTTGRSMGWNEAQAQRNKETLAFKRLKIEVTRLNDRVRALKHENNKLRKELWQRKESK